ncbi:MAG: N-acetylmuramoyl-L-alanine amidase [Verrucomicrobiales bacterium]
MFTSPFPFLRTFPLIGLLGQLFIAEASAYRVVIDAGHGAQEGYVYEKHLALEVARRLEAYLKKRGISSVLTRRSDKFVSLNGRAAVGNRYNDAVFVSIHFNSASNRSATGIEAFYFTPQSELLAPIVHTNVIHKTRTRDRGVKHRGFRVIRTSRNPSILVEGGFISNRGERRRCLTSTHRKKLAESIGHALVIYRKER